MAMGSLSRHVSSMGFGTLAFVVGAMAISLSGCAAESADQNDVDDASADESAGAITITASYVFTSLVANNTSTSTIHVNLSMGGGASINKDIAAKGSAKAPSPVVGTYFGTVTVTANGTNTTKKFTLPNNACNGQTHSLSISGVPVSISYRCS